MSEPKRYVAYYRMPAIGASPSGGTLALQRQSIATFLNEPDRMLVGEFTEVMGPSYEGETPPAFQFAVDCCLTLDATLLVSLAPPGLGPTEKGITAMRGVAVHRIENASDTDSAKPEAELADDIPYLDLKTMDRPTLPKRDRMPVGNRAKADQFADAILPIIEQIRAAGATTLTDIAKELNARQVKTARGRRWYPMTVRNILQRGRTLP